LLVDRRVILPAFALIRLLKIPAEGDHAEAVLLFTSGTRAIRKGVVLSHAILVATFRRFRVLIDAEPP
jgi:long-subunit acyl-CoA synthetase (AMP-forming)